MARKTKDELSTLHAAVAEALLKRVKHPECSSSDFAVAVKFLKDNDIVAVVPTDGKDSETAELEEALAKRKRRTKVTQADIDDALKQLSHTEMLQ